VVDAAGTVATFGGAGFYGDLTTTSTSAIAIVATPDGEGYWLISASGSVSSYGDATFYGSAAEGSFNGSIVGMAATPSGKGYWLASSTGQVLTFGDAHAYGSIEGRALDVPIVAVVASPDGKGYWLVSSSGSVRTYGDVTSFGSAAAGSYSGSIVGMAATRNGKGYWLVSSTGQVLTFGDADAYGSMEGRVLTAPIVGIARTPDGLGYTLVASDGGVFTFGDATFAGSDVNPAQPPMEPASFTDRDPKIVGIVYLGPGESETSAGPIKVSYFGDSLAWLDEMDSNSVAGTYDVAVADAATPGCGIAGDGELATNGSGAIDPPAACASWYQRMRQALASEHPDVVVIELGYWESQPHLWNGSWATLTDNNSYAAAVEENLNDLVTLIKSYSAVPVLLTSAYYGDGTSNAEVDAWNGIVGAIATSSGSVELDLHSLLDPSGSYEETVDGVAVRTSDGVHLTSQGVTKVIDPWLLPALNRIGEASR
jgi:lysophospholipase L1-like esterase